MAYMWYYDCVLCCGLVDWLITFVVFVRTAFGSTTRSCACHLARYQASPLTSRSGGGAYEYPDPSDQEWERNSEVPPWLCLVAPWCRYVTIG